MKSRRIAKRLLKWAVEYASKYSGLASLYRKTNYYRSSFRILTYHRITDSPKTTHDLTRKHFVEHCSMLSGEFRVMSLPELINNMVDGVSAPPGSVAVTFDDGYSEIGGFVAETLERFGIPATFFIVTGYVDREFAQEKGPYVSWNDLRSMLNAGFSIGSHSVSHSSMNSLNPEELRLELNHSRERILDELGRPPCGFSYPYGTLRDFSESTGVAVRKAKYPWAVTAIHGVNPLGSDPYKLKRINMTAGDGQRTLRLIMDGCLDAWELIDRFAYRLQRANYTGNVSSGK